MSSVRQLELYSNSLPAIPEPGGAWSAEDSLRIEAAIIEAAPLIDDIGTADDWRRKAKAIEGYLRSPELQRPMLGAQRRIEARIGQLLGPAPGQGARTDLTSPREEKSLIARDQDRADFRLLAHALDGKCELTDHEWRKSRRALVSLIRNRLGIFLESPALPAGQFCCIVADPPWQQDTGPNVFGGAIESGHDALSYEKLSIERISNYKDKNDRSIQDCVADHAHLYLWTINKYVEQSYAIARAWGFKPSELLTWCKPIHGIGLGDTFRHTTEFILFARRGNLQAMRIIPSTWFQWPRGRHSAKPDEFYEMVESVTPGPARLDFFARKRREGWETYGDQIEDE